MLHGPILDGISEIGAHVRSNICYSICLRHLIRSKAATNRIFFKSEKTYFSSELPSDISFMVFSGISVCIVLFVETGKLTIIDILSRRTDGGTKLCEKQLRYIIL